MARRYDDDPALVLAAQSGDQAAFTMLFQRWFDPCFDVARRIVRNDDTAAEVAQETFLVAWRQLDTLRDASAFGGWVLRTSRNKALNRLEREQRSVAVDQDDHPVMTELEAVDDVASTVAANEQQQLVWAAAAALGERDASVLDLHLRHGLDASEIALALDVTPNNAHQLLFRMKGKLAAGIRAWVLFKGGDPQCDELGRELRQAGALSFSAATVKVIDKHVASCEACTDRQAAILAPEAMFAAVPLLPVAPGLRARAAEALRDSGVPLGPDAAQPPAGPDAQTGSPSTAGPSTGAVTGATSTPGAGPETVLAAITVPLAAISPVGPPPADDTSRSKVLAAVAAVVVLVLLLGGWALLSGGEGDVDVAAGNETTTTTVAARSGTSRPVIEQEINTPTTGADGAPATPSPELVLPPSTSTTTQPVVPTTTATVVPPSIPPPSTTPPTTTAPPVVDSFGVTPPSAPGVGGCSGATPWSHTLTWTTTNATNVSVTSIGGSTTGSPDDTKVVCTATPGAVPWTLTATGPGGSATDTA